MELDMNKRNSPFGLLFEEHIPDLSADLQELIYDPETGLNFLENPINGSIPFVLQGVYAIATTTGLATKAVGDITDQDPTPRPQPTGDKPKPKPNLLNWKIIVA